MQSATYRNQQYRSQVITEIHIVFKPETRIVYLTAHENIKGLVHTEWRNRNNELTKTGYMNCTDLLGNGFVSLLDMFKCNGSNVLTEWKKIKELLRLWMQTKNMPAILIHTQRALGKIALESDIPLDTGIYNIQVSSGIYYDIEETAGTVILIRKKGGDVFELLDTNKTKMLVNVQSFCQAECDRFDGTLFNNDGIHGSFTRDLLMFVQCLSLFLHMLDADRSEYPIDEHLNYFLNRMQDPIDALIKT